MASNSIFDSVGKFDNLHDPEPVMNKKEAILGIVISFLVLSSSCAIGRLCIRSCITRNLGLDDLFVFLSMCSNIVGAVTLVILTSSGGLGQHFILLGIDGMSTFYKAFYAANALYNTSTSFIKLALLFQYLRLVEKASKLRTITIFSIVLVSLWGATWSILGWVPCLPLYAFWDFKVPDSFVTRYAYGSREVDTIVATYFLHAASNMFLDMITFLIPVPLWIRSNAERKTRLALLGLFMLGATVNICSIFRLIVLVEHRAATYPTFDPTWYGSSAIVLSALEVHLATMCASLPVCWPIVKDVLGSKAILVTREVVVKRESRKLGMFHGTNVDDAHSLHTVSSQRPWEFAGSGYGPHRRGLSTGNSSVTAVLKSSSESTNTRPDTPDSLYGA